MWHVLRYLAFCAPDWVKLSRRVLLSIDVFRYGSEIFFLNVYILSYADFISFLMKLTWVVQGSSKCSLWDWILAGAAVWRRAVAHDASWLFYNPPRCGPCWCCMSPTSGSNKVKKGNWGLRHWAYLITSKYFIHLLMVHSEAFPRSVFVQVLLIEKVREQARKKQKANQKPLSTYLTCY